MNCDSRIGLKNVAYFLQFMLDSNMGVQYSEARTEAQHGSAGSAWAASHPQRF
jgi:hypothetical protein